MPQTARDDRYRYNNKTDYVLDGNAARQIMPEYAPQQPQRRPQTAPVPRPRVVPKAQPERRRLKIRTVAALLSLAAVFALVVSGYMKASALSVERSTLQSQIYGDTRLQSQLELELSNKMTLEQIEDYAVNKLGMVKANTTNVKYIDGGKKEQTTIHGNTTSGEPSNFVKGLRKSINAVWNFIN